MPGRTHVVFLALAVFTVGVVALLGTAVSRAQESPATLSFAPPSGPLGAGQQATYVLGIAGAQRLFGADIEMMFDPAVASVVDADPAKEGVQVTILPFLDAGFVVFNIADNTAGKIRVTYTQLAPKAAANGNGGLVSIDLKSASGGDPKLRVSAALLAREDGSPQPVTLPSTGATPVPPSASPAPNPTEIPTPTSRTGASPAATGRVPETTVAGTQVIIPSGPGAESPDDGSSTNWTLPLVLGGVAVAAIAAVVVGRRYLKRNGETE